jgi:hypothetical protein
MNSVPADCWPQQRCMWNANFPSIIYVGIIMKFHELKDVNGAVHRRLTTKLL